MEETNNCFDESSGYFELKKVVVKAGSFEAELDERCCGFIKIDGKEIARVTGFKLTCKAGDVPKLTVDFLGIKGGSNETEG